MNNQTYMFRQYVVTVEEKSKDKYAVEIVDDTHNDTFVIAAYDDLANPSTVINDTSVDPNALAQIRDLFIEVYQATHE